MTLRDLKKRLRFFFGYKINDYKQQAEMKLPDCVKEEGILYTENMEYKP